MEKILLPKSSKKQSLMIFRYMSLSDILIFGIITIIPLILVYAVGNNLNIWIKLVLTVIILLFGFLLILKYNADEKVYYGIFKILKYLVNGKTQNSLVIDYDLKICENNNKLAQFDLFNEINYLGGIKIYGSNLEILNEEEIENMVSSFAELIKKITLNAKIIKINSNFDLEKNINYLQSLKYGDVNKEELINSQIAQMKLIQENKEITSPAIYIIWISKNISEVENQIQNIGNSLFSLLKYNTLSGAEIVKIWKSFCFNNEHINIKPYKFLNENGSGYIWGINTFPKMINYFWLAKLFAINKINVCINMNQLAKDVAKKRFDNALSKANANLIYAKSASEKLEAQQYLDGFAKQQEQIVDDVDVLREFSIYVNIFDDNIENIRDSKRQLISLADIMGWKYNKLSYLQNQALANFYYWKPTAKHPLINYEFITSTFATSFPLNDSVINDEKGFLFGSTTTDKLVIFDLFHKEESRQNSNVLVVGTSGSGKSYTTKKLILNNYYRNCKTIIFDPEREYKNMTENLNGQWLDCNGGNLGIINPWQVYKSANDEANGDAFDNQINILIVLFNYLFPTLENSEKNLLTLLNKLIKKTYAFKNISATTNFLSLENNKYPTFNDLNTVILNELKEAHKTDSDNKEVLIANLQDLQSKVDLLINGIYARYWNGYTSIDISQKDFVCFDLHLLLNNRNAKIKNIQLLLLLNFLNLEMFKIKEFNESNNFSEKDDKAKHILIAIDEAHLFIDEKSPITLDGFAELGKRIRKYYGSLIIATQNLADFSGSVELKKRFTAILNNSQYWLIGHLLPDDLNTLDSMYKNSGGLSMAVKEYISKANQGRFWFKMSENVKIPMQVLGNIPSEEYFISNNNLENN